MFGLRKQIAPVLAEGRETLAVARNALSTLMVVSVAALLVSLATLAAVVFG